MINVKMIWYKYNILTFVSALGPANLNLIKLLEASDVKVEKGWLEPVLYEMDQNPEIAIAQPKILSLKEPKKFEYAGAAGGYMDRLGYPFCRGRIFTSVEEDCNSEYILKIIIPQTIIKLIPKTIFEIGISIYVLLNKLNKT